jgi:hypothetical protein
MTKDEAKKNRSDLKAEAADRWMGGLPLDVTDGEVASFRDGFDAGFEHGKLAAQPQWKRISVDGLPEVEGFYTCTVEATFPQDFGLPPKVVRFVKDWYFYGRSQEPSTMKHEKIIAWRPRLEPYGLDLDLNTEASDGTRNI